VLGAFIGLVGQDLADPQAASFESTVERAMSLLEQLVYSPRIAIPENRTPVSRQRTS
jgi:hypothetical protein